VFDGKLGRAYTEVDEVKPTGVYGLSKARAEDKVLKLAEQALVIRTSAFFGPWDKHNFAWNTLEALARGEPVRANRDTAVSPDLRAGSLPRHARSSDRRRNGHLAPGQSGQIELARIRDPGRRGRGVRCFAWSCRSQGERANTALTSARGIMLRPVENAIDDYLGETESATRPASWTLRLNKA
jgi:dTDP-4-dehydrorhamnose reductase